MWYLVSNEDAERIQLALRGAVELTDMQRSGDDCMYARDGCLCEPDTKCPACQTARRLHKYYLFLEKVYS